MRKFLTIFSLVFLFGCSSNSGVDTFDANPGVFYVPNHRNVRVIYDVVEVDGIDRCESRYLGACDRNTEFYKARKIEAIDERYFYNIRTCQATLCYY